MDTFLKKLKKNHGKITTKDLWDNDNIQFARLISEIDTVGGFTDKLFMDLSIEMGLEYTRIIELIERAKTQFDKIKAKL